MDGSPDTGPPAELPPHRFIVPPELSVSTAMNLFDIGVSPGDPALSAGRRRLFNAVLIFGFLPNIPLFLIGTRGIGPPATSAVVLIHFVVLGGLLFAQHRRVPIDTSVAVGILWTLCYIVFFEWTIGGGRGGTGLVAWALVILGHVLLIDSRNWLTRLALGSAWITATGLWFADNYVVETPFSIWLLRVAAFSAFPLIVLVLLVWYQRTNAGVLAERVRQSVEIEHLLRVAELGQVASGVRHALAHPLQVASFNVEMAKEQMAGSQDPERVEQHLRSASVAMAELTSVVRQLDSLTGTDPDVTSSDCSVAECLDHVRALALTRVGYTSLDVDRDRIPPDARLPVDLLVGTRLMYTLLTSGSEFLRHHSDMKPRLSLATEGREGHTVVSMTLGSGRTESQDNGEHRPIDVERDGPLKSLAQLSREKGWACSAYERFEAATNQRDAVAPTYAVVSVQVTPMTIIQGP